MRDRSHVLTALAAAALFGLSTPLAKGLSTTVPPQLLGGLFYLGSGIGLSLLGVIRKTPNYGAIAPLTPVDRAWLAGAILTGGVLAPPLQLLGIQRTPTSTASLLLNLEGVFTALLAWVVFREHANARTALGMGAIVAGSVALTWSGTLVWSGVAGALAIALACLCWGLDNNFTQKVSGLPAVRIAVWKGLVAGVVNTALALVGGARLPDPASLCTALGIGFLCYGLSLVLFVRALRGLGTARTGAYFSLAPFVGAFAGLVAFRETLSFQFAVATVLMAIGLWLHLTEHHEHAHTHEALEHAHEHTHDDHHQHAHSPEDPPGVWHTHVHRHEPVAHAHPHYPDLHHRHEHDH